MSAARFVGILEILFPMFYMAKRTIRKQSAEIEWSGLDSITDTSNTTLVRCTKRNNERNNERRKKTMTKTPTVLELKKLENGTIAVRWSNKPKRWTIIEDATMAAFILFFMLSK